MTAADDAPAVQRHLAAILCADVEGYARLMNADEAATLRLLNSQREIIDRFIHHFGGRIANTAGDSILAEFPSAVDALRCSLDFQDRLAGINEQVPEERRIHFRVGLHVGEILVRAGDLFGDGVNIAARLQSLAPPGTVCLSETVFQFAHRSVECRFEELGPQALKNLSAPVTAYLAMGESHPRQTTIPTIHRRILFHLARRFHNICDAALADITQPDGLAPVEYAALASIEDLPGLDCTRLAERLGFADETAAAILLHMSSKGLVDEMMSAPGQGSPSFTLTTAGSEVRHRLRPRVVAAIETIVAPLSGQEQRSLHDLLARVIQAHETKGTQLEHPR